MPTKSTKSQQLLSNVNDLLTIRQELLANRLNEAELTMILVTEAMHDHGYERWPAIISAELAVTWIVLKRILFSADTHPDIGDVGRDKPELLQQVQSALERIWLAIGVLTPKLQQPLLEIWARSEEVGRERLVVVNKTQRAKWQA